MRSMPNILVLALLAVGAATAAVVVSSCASPSSEQQGGGGEATTSSEDTESVSEGPAAPSEDATALPRFPGPQAFAQPKENDYFPLMFGYTWTYEGEVDGEPSRNVVTVSEETTTIMGVTCNVLVDRVYVGGVLEEDTRDWYAASEAGDVWYFGEDTRELDENGNVTSTEGSWKAGIDGAAPGIIMKADPQAGDVYMQEYYKGHAEDTARVVGVGESVSVPAGSYDGVLRIEEWSPLEPGVLGEKLYAPSLGQVSERLVKGGDETYELVSPR